MPANLGYLGDGGLGVVASGKSEQLHPRTSSGRGRVGIWLSNTVGLHIHEPGSECLLTLGTRHLACLNLLPALRRGITTMELGACGEAVLSPTDPLSRVGVGCVEGPVQMDQAR